MKIRFTAKDIGFLKPINAGGAPAVNVYLGESPPDVAGAWYQDSGGWRHGAGPLGAHAGIGSYVAVTSAAHNPGLDVAHRPPLVVLTQHGHPTHLVAVASALDLSVPRRDPPPEYPYYRWVKVLAMRKAASMARVRDLLAAALGAPVGPLPIEAPGGSYYALAHMSALANCLTEAQRALWDSFGFRDAPAIFAQVSDPGQVFDVSFNEAVDARG